MNSYLICATPRTGSTLLCGLLQSTGVAGHPESYFRAQDERSWAAKWSIGPEHISGAGYADYVDAAIEVGSTENGVFAARVMWGTVAEVIDKLGVVHPELAGSDRALLTRVFGETRFVRVRRSDALAQAVSWLRAEQTNVWFEYETDDVQHEHIEVQPRFDFDRIGALVHIIDEHNAAWDGWLASIGAQAHVVRYEELVADPVGVTGEALRFLGLVVPAGHAIRARHRRLADELNTEWMDRFRRESSKRC